MHLHKNTSLRAVARYPERDRSSADRLSFVRGDVLFPRGPDTGALNGVEAVISCIGPEKNLSPGTLMSVGVANILTECKRANARRFILQSGIGLSDGRELSWPNRFVVCYRAGYSLLQLLTRPSPSG